MQTDSASKGPQAGILADPWPLKQAVGRRRVALIGHSYIRRLEEFMTRCGRTNLGFAIEDARVDSFHRGGAVLRVVPDDHWAHLLLQPAIAFGPSVIYIHLGENDLDHLIGQSLVDHVINFVRSIITFQHPEVIIVSQLFPMPYYVGKHNLTSINDALSAAVDALNQNPPVVAGQCVTRVVFWRLSFGIWGSHSASLFHHDKIHLSEVGMSKYFHSVHNAVGKALTSL
jgi:hypothetical protein